MDVNIQDEKNATSLHYACSKGYAARVKSLLELGGNPNIIDNAVCTLLLFFHIST